MAPQSDLDRPFGAGKLPRIAVAQPDIGLLRLPPIHNVLGEDAVFVADAVSQAGDFQGGKRIQKAGRQPAQPPVAKSRLDFLGKQGVVAEAQFLYGRTHRLFDAQVQHIVAQVRAQQVFRRQVGHRARALTHIGFRRAHPARQQPVPDRVGERQVIVVQRSQPGKLALDIEQVVQKGTLEGFLGQAGTACFRRGLVFQFYRCVHGISARCFLAYTAIRMPARKNIRFPFQASICADVSIFSRWACAEPHHRDAMLH